MINSLFRYIFAFILIMLSQVLILDNIQFSPNAVPFLYILFLLILPFETPGWLLLLLGFFLGFTVDLFEHTYGIHTAATVLAAWLRPGVLKLYAPRDGYMSNTRPRISDYGTGWFLKYATTLIFVHHFFLFYFETFSFHHFFSTLWRVIVSSLFTLLLVVLSQFFVHKPRPE